MTTPSGMPRDGLHGHPGHLCHVTGRAVGVIQLDNGSLLYDADGVIFTAGPAPADSRDVAALCAYRAS
jgi:hypothetical protein